MTLKVEPTLIDMAVSGGTRRFAVRRVLSMRATNLLADKKDRIAVLRQQHEGSPELRPRIVQLFFSDQATTQDTMCAILVGDHDGICWYDEGDPQQMEDVLMDFLHGINANYGNHGDAENAL